MSYIVSTSILGIQTFVTRFDPSAKPLPDAAGPLPGAPPLNIARVRSIRSSLEFCGADADAASAACGKQ